MMALVHHLLWIRSFLFLLSMPCGRVQLINSFGANGAVGHRGRVAYRLKEQKRSRYKQSTLLIKSFKYGSSLSIFTQKNKEAQRPQVGQFSPLDNNAAREFNSGLDRREIEGKNTRIERVL